MLKTSPETVYIAQLPFFTSGIDFGVIRHLNCVGISTRKPKMVRLKVHWGERASFVFMELIGVDSPRNMNNLRDYARNQSGNQGQVTKRITFSVRRDAYPTFSYQRSLCIDLISCCDRIGRRLLKSQFMS